MNFKKLSQIVALSMLLLAMLSAFAPSSAAAQTQQTAALLLMKAFVDGKEIYFVHLEASDEKAAQQMTDMFKSPVLYVPSLTQVPAEALANVYSFKNGAEGQISVFDNQPGMVGYTPLRQLNMVAWVDGKTPRLLKSVAEINAAQDAGELTVKPTVIVVNMPFVVWNGGKR
jgi:hypothetical protein